MYVYPLIFPQFLEEMLDEEQRQYNQQIKNSFLIFKFGSKILISKRKYIINFNVIVYNKNFLNSYIIYIEKII